MNTPEDARLKRDFENLRENDRRTAPDFLSTVSAARGRAVAVGRPRNRIVIAGVFAFVAVVGTRFVLRSTAPPIKDTGALTSWSSPTAFLLETPGKRFWSETPQLGSRGIYGLPGPRKETK